MQTQAPKATSCKLAVWLHPKQLTATKHPLQVNYNSTQGNFTLSN